EAEDIPPAPPELTQEAQPQPSSEQVSWLGGYWTQAKGLLFSPVSRWAFTSLILLGVFLFFASFVAVWVKKRVLNREEPSYELPSQTEAPVSQEPAAT